LSKGQILHRRGVLNTALKSQEPLISANTCLAMSLAIRRCFAMLQIRLVHILPCTVTQNADLVPPTIFPKLPARTPQPLLQALGSGCSEIARIRGPHMMRV
jgi:hypothetical protein